jgi:hypothetical protein
MRFFTTEVRRPVADATPRRIQAQAFGWINYWRPHIHACVTINYKIDCIKNILNLYNI